MNDFTEIRLKHFKRCDLLQILQNKKSTFGIDIYIYKTTKTYNGNYI